MVRKIRLIVCDYDNPKGYTFPSFGFGSSEKRLWHFAKTASELEGVEVIITGPLWLREYVPKARYFPKRLNIETYQEFLDEYGKCDFLFAGHEYFDKDEWVKPFEKCANVLLSYQLHPYQYLKPSFNGKDKILFCYSDQMMKDYKEQKPVKALLFHSGVDEEPYFVEKHENYLLWMGRLDRDKAPHYAVEAAKILGMPLYILGKTVYQPEYYEANKETFSGKDIHLMGVRFGVEKMEILTKAACFVYTIDKSYSEAGAGVLGEALSCGIPIAGISWTGNDAVCEAVSSDLGKIADVHSLKEGEIAQALADAVRYCLTLNRKKIYEIGSEKYNPHKLVRQLLDTALDLNRNNR
ncbi:MAG: glycosyltransferase [Chloroflexi bacterium]|nr:glycosyltransferase [Chloroflexota bacterium]